MPRGGKRQGAPGKAYSNRTDLSLNQAPSSTGYGDRAAQEQRMAAVPITPPAGPPQVAPQAAPQPLQAPGAFDRPSDRPMEPVTSGLATGPGAGPEALGLPDGSDPDLAAMAPYLPMLERLASLPNATVATRNLVRRLRGGQP